MPISDENLGRLRAALRDLQTIVDDIEREQQATSGKGLEVNFNDLNEVIGEFLDAAEAPPSTVVIMPTASGVQERQRRAEKHQAAEGQQADE
jgi:hypothetical protein